MKLGPGFISYKAALPDMLLLDVNTLLRSLVHSHLQPTQVTSSQSFTAYSGH